MLVPLFCVLAFSECVRSATPFLPNDYNNITHHVQQIEQHYHLAACASANRKYHETCEVNTCNETILNDLVTPDQYTLHHFVKEDPKLKCREETSLSLHWKDHSDFAYFLEINSDTNTTFTSALICSHYRIYPLVEGTEYKIVLWGFSYVDKQYFKSDEMSYKTFPKNHKPAEVKNARIEKHVYNPSHDNYDSTVQWEPNDSCNFYIVWFQDDFVNETQVNVHTSKHEVKLKGLAVATKVTFQIRAMQSRNSTKGGIDRLFYFHTPSCLDTYSSLKKCIPEIPKNVTLDFSAPHQLNNTSMFDVTVSWLLPQYIPDLYIVELFNSADLKNRIVTKSVNVSGALIGVTIKDFAPESFFFYSVRACSSKGCSLPASSMMQHSITEISSVIPNTSEPLAPQPEEPQPPPGYLSAGQIVLIIFGVTLLILCAGGAFYYYYYVYRKKGTYDRGSRRRGHRYGASRERFGELNRGEEDQLTGTDNIELEEKIEEPGNDTFDLDPDTIVIESILGEGAFGVVRKARMKMPDGEMKQIAIKMLKASTTSEEIRQFVQEIEIMKSVKPHPNIVSFIGCTKANTCNGPMLIVEYCSRGDLQSYLRNAWDKFCLMSKETMYPEENSYGLSRFFVNKTYDFFNLDLGDDFIIQPKHLLSIARQVALGMEHLAKTRIVHRDLAARNILVCEDHSVKVSDFGMSRDVYQNNVYCKNGGGRLPIRWMALESLTHQRYTTQSDVWSFGILLWEIVTLGGTPYVGMQTSDLLDFLKSGQRLSRPGSCSPDLYSIMLSCWMTSPKNRPTFTELYKSLDKLLENVSQYLNLENIEIPLNFDDVKPCKQSNCDIKPYVEVC